MLSNINAINRINPFVIEGPGGWRKPYDFSPSESVEDVEPMWESDPELPGCEWGMTTADSSSWLKEQCKPPKNPVYCPMSRPLEPTREIIPDLYTLTLPKRIIKDAHYKDALQLVKFPIVPLLILILILFIAKSEPL